MMENPVRKMKATIKDPFHCERLNLTLQSFHTQERYTDLYFICKGGVYVNAHKLMICSVSPKLKQLFLELPEIVRLQEIHVSVPDIEARILRMVFDFLYEGQVKLDQSDNSSFHEVMTELGFPLSKENTQAAPSQTRPQAQTSAQLPQMVYFQPSHNSQGQIQYLMAPAGSLGQGQMVQAPLMTPVVQGNIAQPSQQPMIMTQANGQLIQSGGQVLANQVQQMQVVQQNNSQVLAMNNQMQVVQQNINQDHQVGGNQVVQCSTQAIVQGNQHNQMQVGMQNQVIANNNYVVNQNIQQPQGQVQQRVRTNNVVSQGRVMNRNQNTVQTQQRTAPAVARGRPMVQAQPSALVNNGAGASTGNLNVEDIMAVLQDCKDITTLTAKKIRSSLEQKIGVELSGQEPVIQRVLDSVLAAANSEEVSGEGVSEGGVQPQPQPQQGKSRNKRPRQQNRRKQSFLNPKSDDEADEDFNPHQHAKKKSSKK